MDGGFEREGADAAIAELDALGRVLLATAAAGDLEGAQAIESQRQRLIRELAEGARSGTLSRAAVRTAFTSALAVTEQAATDLGRARVDGHSELRELKRGQRGARAYLTAHAGA